MDAIAQQSHPLSAGGHGLRLDLRRQIRNQALALCAWAAHHGIALPDVAQRIGITARTLDDWVNRHDEHALDACPRGRPPCNLSPSIPLEVVDLLEHHDGRLGLPTLKALFPEVPRTALADIRQAWIQAHDGSREQLTWTRPGTVWAADYTQVPHPIDGRYPWILSVRDLASNYHLLTWPVVHANARASADAFTYLFAAFGPPLLLKSDNGSHLKADLVLELLATRSVTQLLSPPRTPRYNGSSEAGIGAVKVRTLAIAAAQARPDCWTCNDLERARVEANRDGRPWGPTGPSPEERWQTRTPISPLDRQRFIEAAAAAFADEMRLHSESIVVPPGQIAAVSFNASQRALLTRRAIRRVLIELGLLLVRRVAN